MFVNLMMHNTEKSKIDSQYDSWFDNYAMIVSQKKKKLCSKIWIIIINFEKLK